MPGVRAESRGSTYPPRDAARAAHQPPAPQPWRDRVSPMRPFSRVSVLELTRVDWSRLNPEEWLPLIYAPGHLRKRATLSDRDCQ